MTKKEFFEISRNILQIQSESVLKLSGTICSDEFYNILQAIFTHLNSNCASRIVYCAVGKSFAISRKISSTMASLGVPSFCIQASEASHGDFGMMHPSDIVFFISNSGETKEIVPAVEFCKMRGNITLSITSSPESFLAKNTTYQLLIPKVEEYSSLNPPTTSSTLMLILGDAISVLLSKMRKFDIVDYATLHPSGTIGLSSITVFEFLKKINRPAPFINSDSNFYSLIETANISNIGIIGVTDTNGNLIGSFTDGDLRRAFIKFGDSLFNTTIPEVMTKNPKFVYESDFLISCVKMVKQHKIHHIFVVKTGTTKPTQILTTHDLHNLL